MKWNLLIFACIVLLFSCGETATSTTENNEQEAIAEEEMSDNILSQTEEADHWQLLFDGTSTDQWKAYNETEMPSNWVAEEGVLKVKKVEEGGKDVITKAQFGDFELSLDFMLTDTANSGILYLVKEVADTPIWHNAPEYQLIDDATYLSVSGAEQTKTHLTGENYDLQAAPDRYLKPTGEWNTARIIVDEKHVEHYLNGQKTIEYDLDSEAWKALVANSKFKDYEGYGKAERGHIGLQYHGHEVHFKNIKIREL